MSEYIRPSMAVSFGQQTPDGKMVWTPHGFAIIDQIIAIGEAVEAQATALGIDVDALETSVSSHQTALDALQVEIDAAEAAIADAVANLGVLSSRQPSYLMPFPEPAYADTLPL